MIARLRCRSRKRGSNPPAALPKVRRVHSRLRENDSKVSGAAYSPEVDLRGL